MQYTPNYNLTIGEGSDAVNPLTQIFPNFTTIDGAMEDNKEHGITTASEVTTGGVHAIVRVDPNVPVFRFTATSAWTTGDTMTLDGSAVTVHLADGTAPKSGAYVIGAEVLAIVNSSLVTLMTGASFDGVVSFNSRQGVVTPQSGDYTANQIGYNNTVSGLAATDTQAAIDEIEDQIQNLPSGGDVNYSLTEHIIGTWIDGSALYEKTVDCGAFPNATTKTVAHNISNLKDVVAISGVAVRNDGTSYKALPYIWNASQTIGLDTSPTTVTIVSTFDTSMYTGYLTIRYTKTV